MIVTHELGFACQVADRFLPTEAGRIVEEGRPAQIFSKPREVRTRNFLSAVLDH
ncbi:hypothetical protein [Paracoccus suum]|uniref:hypothetical protein n=1 Tax=Paracoccus suum TaxID=2259340 RepID=UPI0013B06150|nr:hypothetical protein [Paracoccus suum]